MERKSLESGFVGEERETHRAAVEAGHSFQPQRRTTQKEVMTWLHNKKQANWAYGINKNQFFPVPQFHY